MESLQRREHEGNQFSSSLWPVQRVSRGSQFNYLRPTNKAHTERPRLCIVVKCDPMPAIHFRNLDEAVGSDVIIRPI
jgi:hypothetical protein